MFEFTVQNNDGKSVTYVQVLDDQVGKVELRLCNHDLDDSPDFPVIARLTPDEALELAAELEGAAMEARRMGQPWVPGPIAEKLMALDSSYRLSYKSITQQEEVNND